MSKVDCNQKEKVKRYEVTITKKGLLFQQWLKRHSLPHLAKVWYPVMDTAIAILCHTRIMLRKIRKKWVRALILL